MLRAGLYRGATFGGALVQPQATDHFGEVQAWNVDTGAKGMDA